MTDPDIRHGPLEDLQGSLGAKLGRASVGDLAASKTD